MPETIAPPPAAPAAPPPVVPSSAPPIHVTPATVVDKGPAPEPPRKGSAQEKMFEDLRRKAGMLRQQQPTTAKAETPAEPKEEPAEPAPEKTAEPTETTPAATEKKGKVNPWKLVDEHKAARAKAEQEIAELRKSIMDPAKLKELQTKTEQYEKRVKELEEEIRFVNYEKHPEFTEKFKKPYEQAWKRWMVDLRELTLNDPSTGQERPIEPKDVLELVNLDLKSARAKAVETYGEFADDVMNARKEIRGLFDAQNQALELARKQGAEREQQLQKQAQEHMEGLQKHIRETWEKANQEAVSDEKIAHFFKPIEGDEEGNKRLSKGYEMADKAFHSPSPTDPRLTPEQRESVIRLHAAVRNRAAAFGRAMYQNQVLKAKIDELTKELGAFKGAQPGAAAPRQVRAEPGSMSARDSIFAELRKRAR